MRRSCENKSMSFYRALLRAQPTFMINESLEMCKNYDIMVIVSVTSVHKFYRQSDSVKMLTRGGGGGACNKA